MRRAVDPSSLPLFALVAVLGAGAAAVVMQAEALAAAETTVSWRAAELELERERVALAEPSTELAARAEAAALELLLQGTRLQVPVPVERVMEALRAACTGSQLYPDVCFAAYGSSHWECRVCERARREAELTARFALGIWW